MVCLGETAQDLRVWVRLLDVVRATAPAMTRQATRIRRQVSAAAGVEVGGVPVLLGVAGVTGTTRPAYHVGRVTAIRQPGPRTPMARR
jgi:hypothetical protein